MKPIEYNNPLSSNHKRLSYFFMFLGVIFAVETYFKISILINFWPLLISFFGAGFIGIFIKGKRQHPWFVFLGAYLILLSIMFLYFNFTDWDMIKKLWPLFITSLGISFIFNFLVSRGNKLYLFLGLFFFSISGIMFLVFTVSHQLWWMIFIFLGVSIYISGNR